MDAIAYSVKAARATDAKSGALEPWQWPDEEGIDEMKCSMIDLISLFLSVDQMKPIKANKSIFAPPAAKQDKLLAPAILVSFVLFNLLNLQTPNHLFQPNPTNF